MIEAVPTHTTNSVITVSDLRDGRVEDLRLASALGFADPHMIRTLIKRHLPSLAVFGEVSVTQRKPGVQGGRPGTTFFLNRKQAVFITAKSNTERAADVTIQMVEVFDEYLAGTLKPVKVKAHRRQLPSREPARFETPSEVLLDLLQAVRSANHRVMLDPELSIGTALAETLEDIAARKSDPLAQTRGVTFDWNHRRASEDLYFKLKAQGRDVKYPTMPRTVPPWEYGGRVQ